MESKLVVNHARNWVEQMCGIHDLWEREGVEILGNPKPVYDFVLANGQEWTGTPWTKFRGKGYRKMAPNHCFSNAFTLSLVADDLTYYEGWAWCGVLSMHHAWCVDPQGRVVDPTWRASKIPLPETEWQYFGVGFDTKALSDWWWNKLTASILYDLNYNEDAKEFVISA